MIYTFLFPSGNCLRSERFYKFHEVMEMRKCVIIYIVDVKNNFLNDK